MSEMPGDRDRTQQPMPWHRNRGATPPHGVHNEFRNSASMSPIDRRKSGKPPSGADRETACLFAVSMPAASHHSVVQKIGAKASRFIARNLRTRSMWMRNMGPLVTFTFDDVPVSGVEAGARILEREDVYATFYVAGAGCGAMSPNGRLATVEELRALARRGHEIGCHTFTHPAVSVIDTRALAAELDRNGAFLKANVGVAPLNFAFPYGDISFRAKRYLESRFDSCRCNLRGINRTTLDLGALRSYELDNASINRAQIVSLIQETVKSNGWLIFCGHAVDPNPGRFSVTPDLLAFAVAAVKGEGCRPVTIAAGLEIVRGKDGGRAAKSTVPHDGDGDPS